MTVHLDDISSTAEPSVTEFAMVMYHGGPEYRARRLVCCLQVQGYCEGSCNQIIMTVSTIFAELLISLFATTFNWVVHHHKFECFV